jgi:hypothetical protein
MALRGAAGGDKAMLPPNFSKSLGVDQCQFPDQCQSKFRFLSPFELKNGSKNEISVYVNLPLFSVSFCTLCNKKLACPRNIPKHSSRNDLCSLCSFPMREKLHRQFFFGQTDQKLQVLQRLL